MLSLLQRILIPEDLEEEKKRTLLGMLCGAVGIFLNALLFFAKMFAGVISGSVSVMADAFNNLSDAGSSLVSMLGFQVAGRKPDAKHPYGHGRFEYIAALAVAAIIITMGFELMKESVIKILHPEDTEFTFTVFAILLLSILVKFYIAIYNTMIGKRIGSVSMAATAKDSLGDCVATGVVLLCAVLHLLFGISLDGWAGLLVSCFIFYAGISAGRDAISPLLGTPAEPEFLAMLEDMALSFDENIVGVHDIMVHDYGPGRKIVSFHAEVPADGDILALHDVIDNLEKKITRELHCSVTIHMDPVDCKDPRVQVLKEQVAGFAREADESVTIHDFRVVFGESHTNLVFDIVVPYSCCREPDEVCREIEEKISERIGKEYYAVMDVDRC